MVLFVGSDFTKALALEVVSMKDGVWLLIEPAPTLHSIIRTYDKLRYLCPCIKHEWYVDLFYMYIKHHEETLIPKDDATIRVLHQLKSRWLLLLSREDMRQTS